MYLLRIVPMLYYLTYRPDTSVSGASMRFSGDLMAAALMVTQKSQPLITTYVTTRAKAVCVFLLYKTTNISTALLSIYQAMTK